MKTSKTIAQAFIILSVGLFLLPSCKEKRGCTDSNSPNYDPEATMYEFGSCDAYNSNLYGYYSGSVAVDAGYCTDYTNAASITVAESSWEGYIKILSIAGQFSLDFKIENGYITAPSQTLYTNQYIQIQGASGTITANSLNLTVTFSDDDCGIQTYAYNLNK